MAATQKYPRLLEAFRPSGEEIENYSRLIMQHEHRPPSALESCQREAELQLWATRSLQTERQRRSPLRLSA